MQGFDTEAGAPECTPYEGLVTGVGAAIKNSMRLCLAGDYACLAWQRTEPGRAHCRRAVKDGAADSNLRLLSCERSGPQASSD